MLSTQNRSMDSIKLLVHRFWIYLQVHAHLAGFFEGVHHAFVFVRLAAGRRLHLEHAGRDEDGHEGEDEEGQLPAVDEADDDAGHHAPHALHHRANTAPRRLETFINK